MRPFLGTLVLAFASACTPYSGSAGVGGNDVPAVAPSPAPQHAILGKYVVTSVDGAPPIINIGGHEPTITIGKERIHFQSQCIYADWTYKQDEENISTTPYFAPGGSMCARGLAAGEIAIQGAFESARRISQIEGGLLLEGGGKRLELKRVH